MPNALAPEEVLIDAAGSAEGLRLQKYQWDESTGKLGATGGTVTIPARTILVAAGTQPNTVLAREDERNVTLDGRYFQAFDETGHPVKPERIAKPHDVYVLMSLRPDGRAISFFGDLHPSFSGNVVKAMASAKQGYPVVSRVLRGAVETIEDEQERPWPNSREPRQRKKQSEEKAEGKTRPALRRCDGCAAVRTWSGAIQRRQSSPATAPLPRTTSCTHAAGKEDKSDGGRGRDRGPGRIRAEFRCAIVTTACATTAAAAIFNPCTQPAWAGPPMERTP